MMAAASKIWEKVLDFLSLDRRGLQGEGLDRRSRAVRRCIRLRGRLSVTNRFSAWRLGLALEMKPPTTSCKHRSTRPRERGPAS